MKKIGMIGGFGPESTLDYYRLIIKNYREVVDDGTYPEIVIYSMDINRLMDLVGNEEWAILVEWLVDGINALHRAGAEFGFISANTPHIIFDRVSELSPIPLISIVKETCKKVQSLDVKKVGLLGTRFTMQSSFYKDVFSKENINIVVPKKEEQEYIHQKLMTEIELGNFLEETRQGLLDIIKRMLDEEAIECVILGCTELPLILTQDEFGIPFLNTTLIHVESVIKTCID